MEKSVFILRRFLTQLAIHVHNRDKEGILMLFAENYEINWTKVPDEIQINYLSLMAKAQTIITS